MPKRFLSDDDFEQFDDSPQAIPSEQSDEPSISLHNYEKKSPTDIAQLKKLSMDGLRTKIQTHAISFLARREYSKYELKNKLNTFFSEYVGYDEYEAVITQVLDYLERGNWQSDVRYAAQIAKNKGEHFGLSRLKHEFQKKGLSDELIQHELDALKTNEFERAQEVWRKKFGHPPADIKEKAKQIRFMVSRGFSFDVANRIIRNSHDLT